MNQCNEITSWDDATFNFTSSFQNLIFYFYIWMGFHFTLYLMYVTTNDMRFWNTGLKLETLGESDGSKSYTSFLSELGQVHIQEEILTDM